MTTNKVVYEVEVTGAEAATATVAKFESTLAQKGTAAASQLGDVFKGLSRDIDVIGGQMTAQATKGISDVLGVVEALGSGGILGPIAVVTTVIGGIVTLVGQWKAEEEEVRKKAEEVKKAHEAALTAATEWAGKLAGAMQAGNAAVTDQEIAIKNATISARGLAEAQLILEVGIARVAKARASDVAGMRAADAQEREAVSRLAEFKAGTAALVVERDRRLDKQVKDEARAARQDEAREYNKALDEKAKARKAAAEAALREERETQAAMASSRAASEKSSADHTKLLEDDRREAAEERARWDKSITDLEALQAENEAAGSRNAEAAEQKAAEQLARRTEKEEDLRRAIQERTAAQVQATKASLMDSAANETHAASMMVITAAMGPVTQQLQQFGRINRENYRDMLTITENTVAAWAAIAQAAAWSLALQAGAKSIYETAEAYKETALAFGSIAMYDSVGASNHFISAGIHSTSAAAYAAIGGGAAGVSLGIGAMRGEGGLVGLTKEEREKQERDRAGPGGSRDTGPALGGPSTRGSTGGNAGPVVVNFVYEAGAINAQDRDAAAATVARASSTVRRDGFMRRRANG